jgi:MFS family permease
MPARSTGASDHARAMPRSLVAVVGWGVAATYLGWPQLLARLPLGLTLKNDLALSPQQVAAFWAVATIPWYLKPIAGLVADASSRAGRRRGSLVLGSLGGALAWLAFAVVPRGYAALLVVAVGVNVALVFVSATVGGLLSEVGQRHGATGRLSSLRQTLVGGVNLAAGPMGGWLAGRAFGWTVGLGALIVGSFAPVVLTLSRQGEGSPSARPVVGARVRETLSSRTTLTVAALVFLFYVAPGLQTPLLYYQQDVLHFDPLFMGLLQTWAGAGVIIGASIYAIVCRFVPIRWSLPLGVVLSAATTLGYLGYHSRTSAIVIHFLTAITGTMAVLPVYDLAARAAPEGSEGFGYSFILGMQTLATYAVSDVIGSYLYGRLHVGFARLVWIDALTTLAVLSFLPAVPRGLLATRDGAGRVNVGSSK